MTTWQQRWQRLSPVGCGLGLFVALLASGVLASPIAWHLNGPTGLAAAGVGALICWLGTIAALVVVEFWRTKIQPAYAVLIGMGVRMVLPLIGAIWLQSSDGPLSEAGVVYYLIVFYQVALILETIWFVARLETSGARSCGDHG